VVEFFFANNKMIFNPLTDLFDFVYSK